MDIQNKIMDIHVSCESCKIMDIHVWTGKSWEDHGKIMDIHVYQDQKIRKIMDIHV